MEIACTVRRSFPGPGGIATALRSTAVQLAKRHIVKVWASRIDEAPFTRLNTTLTAQVFPPQWIEGVELRPVPIGVGGVLASAPMSLLTVPGLRRYGYKGLRRATAAGYVRAVGAALARDWGSPSVVHCWGGEHVNWAAGRAAGRAELPLVITPFAHPGAWGDDPVNVEFYKTAQIVLALLPSEARFYASLGIDPDRIRVVGVPVTPLPPSGPEVRVERALGDVPVVLFLGVKEPYKGYRTLLEAAPLVWRELPETRFVFVGPTTGSSLEDLSTVEDVRIVDTGAVSAAEVRSWLRAATVLCLPSTSEIMPVSILEAWNEAKPVVAAEWWCAHDLVTHERDGLVVQPDAESVAKALVRLLREPDVARAMGEAGRAKVLEHYTPEAVAERHEQAYRDAGAA